MQFLINISFYMYDLVSYINNKDHLDFLYWEQ